MGVWAASIDTHSIHFTFSLFAPTLVGAFPTILSPAHIPTVLSVAVRGHRMR